MSNYNAIKSAIDDAFSAFPDMFQFWGAALPKFRETRKENLLGSNGLKSVITRPHNLYVTKTTTTGVPVAYNIDLVYTPFKKEDIRIELLDGVVTVNVGVSDDEKAAKDVDSSCGAWIDCPEEDFDELTADPTIPEQEANKIVALSNLKDRVNTMVYRGISKKPFSFQLYVKNFFDDSEEIDIDAIKASADEGVLHLTFPLKKKTPAPESKAVQIHLS